MSEETLEHKRNIDFCLYTTLDENASDSYFAVKHLQSYDDFMFKHLHYGDFHRKDEVIDSIKLMLDDNDIEIEFPFITYRKLMKRLSDGNIDEQIEIVVGREAIEAIDWEELENFRGSNDIYID